MKAEPEVHLRGEFDFVTPRLSEFAPVGFLGSNSEATFRFQKQAGIQGSVLTYVTIADAMVNKAVYCHCVRYQHMIKA